MSEIPPIPPIETTSKQRHGCLTAYLIFMIIANSAAALSYVFNSEAIRQALPDMPGWAIPVLTVGCLFNLACAVALFRWKKWGFWGFVGSAIVVLALNLLIGLGIGTSLGGLLGIAILYGVLQIGDSKNGWTQLE